MRSGSSPRARLPTRAHRARPAPPPAARRRSGSTGIDRRHRRDRRDRRDRGDRARPARPAPPGRPPQIGPISLTAPLAPIVLGKGQSPSYVYDGPVFVETRRRRDRALRRRRRRSPTVAGGTSPARSRSGLPHLLVPGDTAEIVNGLAAAPEDAPAGRQADHLGRQQDHRPPLRLRRRPRARSSPTATTAPAPSPSRCTAATC